MAEYETQSDERTIYIANIPNTRAWMMLITPKPPKAGFYRGYVVPSDRMNEAMDKADGLVVGLQGKLSKDVTLPDSLV